MDTEQKYNSLIEIIKPLQKVIVAYSGGVDSAFLLKVTVDTLGPQNVIACIGVSPSLSKAQYNQAIDVANTIGAQLKQIQIHELDDPNYSDNKPDRCFHCKSHLYTSFLDLAKQQNYDTVICGANYDDADDYRPGNRAAIELGVLSPLMDAKLTKQDIRTLSRKLNLPTADLPASPCLASRLTYGLEVTDKRLKQIELAEDLLREIGFVEFRVRHHDNIARIELKPEDIKKIADEKTRTKIADELKKLGFKYITLDLQGFRSGSMNEALTEDQKNTHG